MYSVNKIMKPQNFINLFFSTRAMGLYNPQFFSLLCCKQFSASKFFSFFRESGSYIIGVGTNISKVGANAHTVGANNGKVGSNNATVGSNSVTVGANSATVGSFFDAVGAFFGNIGGNNLSKHLIFNNLI